MKVTVGTTSTAVPKSSGAQPVIQNLGPGTLYIDTVTPATAAGGLQLPVGSVFEMAESSRSGDATLYMIADAAGTDVRILQV